MPLLCEVDNFVLHLPGRFVIRVVAPFEIDLRSALDGNMDGHCGERGNLRARLAEAEDAVVGTVVTVFGEVDEVLKLERLGRIVKKLADAVEADLGALAGKNVDLERIFGDVVVRMGERAAVLDRNHMLAAGKDFDYGDFFRVRHHVIGRFHRKDVFVLERLVNRCAVADQEFWSGKAVLAFVALELLANIFRNGAGGRAEDDKTLFVDAHVEVLSVEKSRIGIALVGLDGLDDMVEGAFVADFGDQGSSALHVFGTGGGKDRAGVSRRSHQYGRCECCANRGEFGLHDDRRWKNSSGRACTGARHHSLEDRPPQTPWLRLRRTGFFIA